MAPRALTEREKLLQREHLLQKGRELIITHGIKKTSVDDIAKAAGMAKGSFYNHFANKEEFLVALTWQFHREIFEGVARAMEGATQGNLRQKVEGYIRGFFSDPQQLFFLANHEELGMLLGAFGGGEAKSLQDMERQMFTRLLVMAGVDTSKVNPAVVHNLVHTMYFMNGSDLMIGDAMAETFEVQVRGLLDYIFGGERGE